ncbi:MAG: tRNA lysidine(34) synthetase TilS, partial [Gammaproteobacteria bacterium]|nr:tRNA lysidine(34) synthetase TilS [Gammaproteobacteria bacterium]
MKFSPEALLSQLDLPAATQRVVVAYSGGLDSTVLLHALARLGEQLPGPLVALHIDHSLQADSPRWAEHCREVALSLGVDFSLLKILVDPAPGASVEAAARDGRYAAFAEFLEKGDVLLTAQHADDQAETFLLQALRGAGVAGLAAMPRERELGAAMHLRPLLDWTRVELEAWAVGQELDWLDDPSNADDRFDRNFLRNRVLPELRERFPGMAATLSRSAGHCADASEILAEEAAQMLVTSGGREGFLPLAALESLSTARQRLLLRHWLAENGVPALSDAQLAEALAMLEMRPDAEP